MAPIIRSTFLFVLLALFLTGCGGGSDNLTYEQKYYANKMREFKEHPPAPNTPMMIGDSITYKFLFSGYYPSNLTNRGIAGDTVQGVLERIPFHLAEHPSEMLLLIGANNALNTSVDDYVSTMTAIVDAVYKANVPLTIISVLPQAFDDATTLMVYNSKLKELCESRNVRFLNIYDDFLQDGTFNKALFSDEVHPNSDGYKLMRTLFDEKNAI